MVGEPLDQMIGELPGPHGAQMISKGKLSLTLVGNNGN